MEPTQKSEAEWKQELAPEAYEVLRNGSTEAPFSGEYLNHNETGVYRCKACGAALFSSKDKLDSSEGDPGLSGWPSFSDPAVSANIGTRPDNSHGMHRTEVYCKNCGGHLGHVFDDVIQGEKQKHYCVNSVCLSFEQEDVDNKPSVS